MLRELEETVRKALKILNRSEDSHGMNHCRRVAYWVKKLGKTCTGIDVSDLQVLAFTHDLEDPKYGDVTHTGILDQILSRFLSTLSVSMARKIIKRASWSNEQQQLRDTKTRDWSQELGSAILYRHLLSDADKLDAIDEQGLQRCALYVLEKNPSWTKEDTRVFEAVKLHAHEKLLKIPEFLHSDLAQQVGAQMRDSMLEILGYFQPKIKMSDLGCVASGLNIEGGHPFRFTKFGSKWVNVVLVLDHPLHSSVDFAQVLKETHEAKFPLLENSFPEINERCLLAVYLMILNYYKDQRVLVHIHQFPQFAQEWIRILREFGCNKVQFLTDDPTFRSLSSIVIAEAYAQADVVVSLSQCAGVDHKVPTGSFLIPKYFIPMENNELDLTRKYEVHNDFSSVPLIATVVDYVNCHYKSANKKKVELAHLDEIRKILHFNVTMLEYKEIWNPLPVAKEDPEITLRFF